jgi:hypothetical protein
MSLDDFPLLNINFLGGPDTFVQKIKSVLEGKLSPYSQPVAIFFVNGELDIQCLVMCSLLDPDRLEGVKKTFSVFSNEEEVIPLFGACEVSHDLLNQVDFGILELQI